MDNFNESDDLIRDLENMANSMPGLASPGSFSGINQSTSLTDFNLVETQAEAKARSIVMDMSEFYLTDDMRKDPFIKQRIQFDIANLSDQIFSLLTTLYVAKKVLNSIDQGAVTARMVEAYTALVSQKQNVNKQIALLQVYLSESYKKLALEWKEQNNIIDERDIKKLAKDLNPSNEIKGTHRDILRLIDESNEEE